MSTELQGRTAIVTGASKGIGLAVVQALAGAGARVVAGSRTTTEALDTLVKEGSVTWVPVDLAEPGAAEQLVAAAGERVDILVNNVGAAPARTGGFLSVTDEDWQRTVDLNLLTAVRVTRAALPVMLAALPRLRGDGRVGQRHPARPVGDRLQRGQGGAGRLLQGAVEGGRPEGHPGQHRQPGSGGDRAVARRRGWPRPSRPPPGSRRTT